MVLRGRFDLTVTHALDHIDDVVRLGEGHILEVLWTHTTTIGETEDAYAMLASEKCTRYASRYAFAI